MDNLSDRVGRCATLGTMRATQPPPAQRSRTSEAPATDAVPAARARPSRRIARPRSESATPAAAALTAGAPFWVPGAPLTTDKLASLAADQHGVVTIAQCRDAHLSERQIAHRVATGRWARLHRGVYLTVPGREGFLTRATAALLACSTDAALSHDSAAYLHGLRGAEPALIDVVIPERRRIAVPDGVRLHRCEEVGAHTHDLLWPWRTTVEHTVLDLVTDLDLDATIALIARACSRRLTTPAAVRAALSTRPRQKHATRLREILSEVAAGRESPLEVRFARDVQRAHGLPMGVAQQSTGRAALHDIGFPELRVLIELDGRLGHEGSDGRHRDAGRDRRTSAQGWLTVRATWRDVAGTPCRLASELGGVMSARGWDGRPRRCRRPGCSVGFPER